MKRKLIMLTAGAITLALVLAATAFLYDRLVDRERLAQASTQPHHTAPTVQTIPTEDTTAPTKGQAPDFTVYDPSGKAVSLDDFRGKPIVLSFWTSWRSACREQMPTLQAAYDDYKDTVHFLIVNMPDGTRETQQAAEVFLQDRGYTFPVYYDTDSTAAINYNVQSVPTTFFIDAEGHPIAYAAGKLSRANFEKGLAQCYHNN